MKEILWGNVKTFHHRVMMRFLRKRGWVVFYLPKENRRCDCKEKHLCWLEQYNKQD